MEIFFKQICQPAATQNYQAPHTPWTPPHPTTMPPASSFRLNPGFGKGAFSQIVTGGKDSKFGVPHYDVVKAYRLAKESGISKFGIQCMTGSGVLDPDYYPKLIKEILKAVRLLKKELDI